MAVTFVCPKGDQSEDPDYCSVCGTKIEGGMGAATMGPAVERCPSCGIERIPGARFCETCRYDFKAQTATGFGAPSPITATSDPEAGKTLSPGPDPSAASIAPNVLSAARETGITTNTAQPIVATRYWEAIVSVDCSLDIEPDPESQCPSDRPDRTFPVDLAENSIGRRSAARGILPSIALSDPGVSHRHLMVYRERDGSLMVSDVGSTNGSFLNGSTDRMEPGVKAPVADGDTIELGRWTRITFHCRS